jgi:hypothetical protein
MLHSLLMAIMLALLVEPNFMVFVVILIQKRAFKIRTAAHCAELQSSKSGSNMSSCFHKFD